jgi:hypothetical protein
MNRIPASGAAAVSVAGGRATNGTELAGVSGFWFAWFAFHPETEVFSADKADVD